ncbi:Condensation domain-containing protein [Anaeromicropila populeti]|uniref:Condensation domain-containing protein n=2 Tax=Anaeromicropila populeti TaxID=37658 RepID=A0A1I6JBH2_9FIRM|nr:Condensation domain-containing protein [Anaeromicropila populeti]
MAAHHLVIDGVSWNIIIDFLVNTLEHNQKAVIQGTSYQRWARYIAGQKGTGKNNLIQPVTFLAQDVCVGGSCD